MTCKHARGHQIGLKKLEKLLKRKGHVLATTSTSTVTTTDSDNQQRQKVDEIMKIFDYHVGQLCEHVRELNDILDDNAHSYHSYLLITYTCKQILVNVNGFNNPNLRQVAVNILSNIVLALKSRQYDNINQTYKRQGASNRLTVDQQKKVMNDELKLAEKNLATCQKTVAEKKKQIQEFEMKHKDLRRFSRTYSQSQGQSQSSNQMLVVSIGSSDDDNDSSSDSSSDSDNERPRKKRNG